MNAPIHNTFYVDQSLSILTFEIKGWVLKKMSKLGGLLICKKK